MSRVKEVVRRSVGGGRVGSVPAERGGGRREDGAVEGRRLRVDGEPELEPDATALEEERDEELEGCWEVEEVEGRSRCGRGAGDGPTRALGLLRFGISRLGSAPAAPECSRKLSRQPRHCSSRLDYRRSERGEAGGRRGGRRT